VDYAYGDEEEALRSRLRALIDTHVPDDFAGIFVEGREPFEFTKEFCRVLADEGLLTLSWPAEYGGQDASVWQQMVLREETWAHDEPRGPQYMGLHWVGPAIMAFGTDEQKREHLSRISAGDAVWCQGFSEPDAGSDLASLRLRATRTGEGWLLNGQKIWTSFADLADWCFLAARTDSDGPKQHGITVFLLPMDRPGITVRPIDTFLGPHHLNEVFFEDVIAYDAEILGEVDRGWDVVTAGLTFERTGAARYARASRILAEVGNALADRWDEVPSAMKVRLARAAVRTKVVQLLYFRVLAEYADGGIPRHAAPLAKIASTTLDQEVADVAMDLLGWRALLGHDAEHGTGDGNAEHHWRYFQSATVAGGTLEIQKMLVARQMVSPR
jgi:alkylation response protein AidB-like acyl-CoA dehydrogenase